MSAEDTTASSGIMKLLDWIAKLALLNVLWILFTLLGGVLLGIGPATYSVYSLIRKKLRMGDIAKIVSSFYEEWKKSFAVGNKLFAIIGGVAFFLYVDYQLIEVLPAHPIIPLLVIPALVIVSLLWTVLSLFVFSIVTHFEYSILESFKKAFWFILISPLEIFIVIMAISVNGLIIKLIPASFLFFSITPLLLITQWMFLRKIKHLEQKSNHTSQV